MIRRPPRSTLDRSSAASDVYKRQITHCTRGASIWGWASNDQGQEPDVVMACAGDIPTQEALAATALLRSEFPDLKIRFVNVVDLFKLQADREHPHGLS